MAGGGRGEVGEGRLPNAAIVKPNANRRCSWQSPRNSGRVPGINHSNDYGCFVSPFPCHFFSSAAWFVSVSGSASAGSSSLSSDSISSCKSKPYSSLSTVSLVKLSRVFMVCIYSFLANSLSWPVTELSAISQSLQRTKKKGDFFVGGGRAAESGQQSAG